ncbi:hypothetical protein [Polaromonas sp.]|uniref:hypothetical protein n=1 Tax=Polaromonas sp. TaxID=1869339 RepID=UPI0017D825F8|nr:hypothetical protein [Polaromonas sp.]NML87428.1 hypothetical protein [Polaromonas sp.]
MSRTLDSSGKAVAWKRIAATNALSIFWLFTWFRLQGLWWSNSKNLSLCLFKLDHHKLLSQAQAQQSPYARHLWLKDDLRTAFAGPLFSVIDGCGAEFPER